MSILNFFKASTAKEKAGVKAATRYNNKVKENPYLASRRNNDWAAIARKRGESAVGPVTKPTPRPAAKGNKSTPAAKSPGMTGGNYTKLDGPNDPGSTGGKNWQAAKKVAAKKTAAKVGEYNAASMIAKNNPIGNRKVTVPGDMRGRQATVSSNDDRAKAKVSSNSTPKMPRRNVRRVVVQPDGTIPNTPTKRKKSSTSTLVKSRVANTGTNIRDNSARGVPGSPTHKQNPGKSSRIKMGVDTNLGNKKASRHSNRQPRRNTKADPNASKFWNKLRKYGSSR